MLRGEPTLDDIVSYVKNADSRAMDSRRFVDPAGGVRGVALDDGQVGEYR
jgi:hypothetical protein